MVMRVGYLWLWLSVASLCVCYTLLSSQSLAEFAVDQMGERAAQVLADHGPFGLYWHSVGVSTKGAAPYLLLGLLSGLLCRGLWWGRGWRRKRAMRGTHTVVDRFGGRTIMIDGVLEYDADNRELRGPFTKPDATALPRSVSPIEVELLALYHHFREVPADAAGFHGTSLFDHSVAAWQRAVKRHGAGSLQAILALAHDAGKLLAYEKDRTGKWRRAYAHEILALQVVGELESFTQWEHKKRDEFISLLTALVTGEIPLDFGAHERAMLRELRSIDARTTHQDVQQREASAQASAEQEIDDAPPPLDAAAIAQLVGGNLIELLEGINVNQSRDASTRVGAIYMEKDGILYLPEEVLQKRLLAILPAEIAQELKLIVSNSKAAPDSPSALIGEVAAQLFDLLDVVGDKQARAGRFRIKWERIAWDRTFAIRTKDFPDKLKKAWGTWNYEIDIFTPTN